jgi:hypothetical protein
MLALLGLSLALTFEWIERRMIFWSWKR